jgi:hypothetical protein
MEYLVTECNPNIVSEVLQFWKCNTKRRWLKELLKHSLNQTYEYVNSKIRVLISWVIPLTLTTGTGAEPLDYIR